MVIVKRVVLVILVLIACPSAAQQAPDEHALRAAMVFNLMLFVDWPAATLDQAPQIRLCFISESSETTRAFNSLGGRQLKSRGLEVHRRGPLAALGDCHAVYLDDLPSDLIADKLASIAAQPVLTLASSPGSGAMIDVTLIDNRLVFDVSADTLRRAGLSLASRVMQLARNVHRR